MEKKSDGVIKHIDESKERTKQLEEIDYRTTYAVLYEYMERSGERCTPRKEERDSVTKYDDKQCKDCGNLGDRVACDDCAGGFGWKCKADKHGQHVHRVMGACIDFTDKKVTEPSIPVSTITVLYKIDRKDMRLLGCEGVYEVSNWVCVNCTEQQRLSCRTLLNKHPDMAGRLW